MDHDCQRFALRSGVRCFGTHLAHRCSVTIFCNNGRQFNEKWRMAQLTINFDRLHALCTKTFYHRENFTVGGIWNKRHQLQLLQWCYSENSGLSPSQNITTSKWMEIITLDYVLRMVTVITETCRQNKQLIKTRF